MTEQETTTGLDKPFWSIKELADSLGVSNDTIEREIKRRRVKAKQVGRKILIPASEVPKILRPKK